MGTNAIDVLPNALRAFVLLFFAAITSTVATSQQLSSFQHFTFISDFPQNTVQAIHQDSRGYIWVGTESGLNRYDGKRIVNYKLGLNENITLTGKIINNITSDKLQNLWVATDNGLSLFSPNGTPEKNNSLFAIAEKINRDFSSLILHSNQVFFPLCV